MEPLRARVWARTGGGDALGAPSELEVPGPCPEGRPLGAAPAPAPLDTSPRCLGAPFLGANRGFAPRGLSPIAAGTQEGDVPGTPCLGSAVQGGWGRRLCSSAGVSSRSASLLLPPSHPALALNPALGPAGLPGSQLLAQRDGAGAIPSPAAPSSSSAGGGWQGRTPRPGHGAALLAALAVCRVPPRGGGAEPWGCSAPALGLQEERCRGRTQRLRGFGEGAWLPSAFAQSPLGAKFCAAHR